MLHRFALLLALIFSFVLAAGAPAAQEATDDAGFHRAGAGKRRRARGTGTQADERPADGRVVTAAYALAGEGGEMPPIWLVIPFALLLLMIATGPLFYAHFWHHHYPKVAVSLGLLVAAYYLLVLGDGVPILHAAEEYFAFIALLGSLYVASGCILIKTDFAGTPRANSVLLLVGAVLSNFIGTTGASMLLIRPFMRLNAGRLKAYHIIFFIFIVSNVGGALTPIGDPPLFLGFLRGVPFFWTVTHIWYIWLPTVLLLTAVFYVIDGRNKETSLRGRAEGAGLDVTPGDVPGADFVPEAPGVQDVDDIHVPGEVDARRDGRRAEPQETGDRGQGRLRVAGRRHRRRLYRPQGHPGAQGHAESTCTISACRSASAR